MSKVRVDCETGCWEWQGARDRDGYGVFRVTGKARRAHRVAYELFVGELPSNLDLDHVCDLAGAPSPNRCCVWPRHLRPATTQENVRRSRAPQALREIAAAKTHCAKGHAYAEHGRVNDKGERICRACERLRKRAFYARRRKAEAVKTAPAQVILFPDLKIRVA